MVHHERQTNTNVFICLKFIVSNHWPEKAPCLGGNRLPEVWRAWTLPSSFINQFWWELIIYATKLILISIKPIDLIFFYKIFILCYRACKNLSFLKRWRYRYFQRQRIANANDKLIIDIYTSDVMMRLTWWLHHRFLSDAVRHQHVGPVRRLSYWGRIEKTSVAAIETA